MKKRGKKLLSYLLTLVLVLGLVPWISLTAEAEGETSTSSDSGNGGSGAEAKVISIVGATAVSRIYYKGTKEVEICAVTFWDGSGSVNLENGTDYTATGTMSNADAGTGKTVNVTVELKNNNYSLSSNKTTTTVDIYKVAAPAIADITKTYPTSATTISESVAGKMPDDAGTVTYSAGSESHTGGVTVSNFEVNETSGAVTASLSGGAANDTVTLPVTISSTNYNDTTVNVKITLVDKAEQTITAEPLTATYGDTNAKVTASTNGGESATITYAVKSGSEDYIEVDPSTGALTLKKVGTAYVVVTAAATADYKETTKVVTITINKAAAQDIYPIKKTLPTNTTSISESVAGKMPKDAGTVTYAKGSLPENPEVTVSNFAVNPTTGVVTANFSNVTAGKSVTLPVIISSTNYGDTEVNVEITFAEMQEAEVAIADAPTTKTYGDADFTLTGSVTAAGTGTGNWTWSTSDNSVFQITPNGATATVKILKAGAATITAEYASDTTYGSKVTETIMVKQKDLTIKALNQTINVGDDVPTLGTPKLGEGTPKLGVDYTVEGFVGEDKITRGPDLVYEVGGRPVLFTQIDNTKPGKYNIIVIPASVMISNDNYEIKYVKGVLTIQANPTPNIPPTTDPTTPATPTEEYTASVTGENTVEVKAEITDGTAKVEDITQSDLDKIVNASGAGATSDPTSIIIDVSRAKTKVDSVELSNTTVGKLADTVNDENNINGVEVKLTDATVELDGKALGAITDQATGGTVRVLVNNKNADHLNAAQQTALAQFESATPFQVSIVSNGEEIHDLKGGTATVSVKYEPEIWMDLDYLHVYHFDKNGKAERRPTRYLDRLVTFQTEGLSDYAIVYDESIKNGDLDDPTDPTDPTDPKDPTDPTDPTNPTDPTDPNEPVKTIDMFRLYNPNSGEHFYTGNEEEKDGLVSLGWNFEGIEWTAPVKSKDPVYRLYNPNAGDHHYTMSEAERNHLIELGWNDEGIGWYSVVTEREPIYRLYNPNATTGTHHFTASEGERDYLISLGWQDEKIGWYGLGEDAA